MWADRGIAKVPGLHDTQHMLCLLLEAAPPGSSPLLPLSRGEAPSSYWECFCFPCGNPHAWDQHRYNFHSLRYVFFIHFYPATNYFPCIPVCESRLKKTQKEIGLGTKVGICPQAAHSAAEVRMELVLPDSSISPCPDGSCQCNAFSLVRRFPLPSGVFAGNCSFCRFLGPSAIEIDGQAGAGVPKERLDPWSRRKRY